MTGEVGFPDSKDESFALFGSPYPTSYRLLPELRQRLGQQVARVVTHAQTMASLSSEERRRYITEKLRGRESRRAAERAVQRARSSAQRSQRCVAISPTTLPAA